jgi:ATP-dependent DNA helicase HFM1/MER3
MCESQLVNKYQALTQGTTILESSLHHNLLEHLNSEIALGTIGSSQAAKDWLRGSFLYQRLQQNPNHYAIQQVGKDWKEELDEIVIQNVAQLESANLIRRTLLDSEDSLESTEFGDIMSKVYSRQFRKFEHLSRYLEVLCPSNHGL